MPPDPGSMQSSPDSILASLQPSGQESTKESSLQSIGSEGEGSEGEIDNSLFLNFGGKSEYETCREGRGGGVQCESECTQGDRGMFLTNDNSYSGCSSLLG